MDAVFLANWMADDSQCLKAISAAWVANSVVRTLPAMFSEEPALRKLVMAKSDMTTSKINAMINTTPFCSRAAGNVATGRPATVALALMDGRAGMFMWKIFKYCQTRRLRNTTVVEYARRSRRSVLLVSNVPSHL